jgi:hypothetical protein
MERRGLVNRYICRDCNTTHYTVNLNHGVTPFGTYCSFCGSDRAFSTFYNLGCTSHITIQFCWYRPTAKRFSFFNKEAQEHILKGGLVKSAIGTCEVLQPDPIMLEQHSFEILRRIYNVREASIPLEPNCH